VFVYVEYIARKAGVALDDFHALTGYTQPRWSSLFPEDELLLNLGRTWRIGAEPEYLAVWLNRAAGLERLDQWGATFADLDAIPELPVIEHGFLAAAQIELAGVFRPLRDPEPGPSPAYYAEFFAPAAGAETAAVRADFERRTADGITLHVLAARVGLLGHDPGLAIWGADSFAALAPAIESRADAALATPVRGALYANLGDEVR
jgi:hypothetical protein